MTQSIIVYRNPLEAMFWESGIIFPLVVGVILGILVSSAVAVIWLNLSDRYGWMKHIRIDVVVVQVAVIVVIGTMVVML